MRLGTLPKRASAMPGASESGHLRCRANPKAGAWRAKRPREISSAQAREKLTCFFRKKEKTHILRYPRNFEHSTLIVGRG